MLAALLIAALQPTLARAQATSEQLGEITVTADRVDEPANATGSDVTVIPGSRIQEWGANGITEVLREAVGVDVTPSGGPNTATEVRIRGGDPGQSLVMIDGIPIGNVAGTLAVDRGYFQTANLADAEAPPHRPSSAHPVP